MATSKAGGLMELGNLAQRRGNLVEAERLLQELWQSKERLATGSGSYGLETLHKHEANLAEAERLNRESLVIKREIDRQGGQQPRV